MPTEHRNYVAKAEAGVGWRIFNRKTKRWWGNFFLAYPQDVLDELNGPARPDILVKLCKLSLPREQIQKFRRPR